MQRISSRLPTLLFTLLLGLPFGLLLGHAAPLQAKEAGAVSSPEISEADMRARLGWLAADERKGRDAVSEEAVVASQWIADQWKRFGLLPKGTDGSWFQPFAIQEPVLKEGNELSVALKGGEERAYAVEKDWNPFSITGTATAEGEVVFAGYGISAPGEPFDYDDYADVDVKGKVVLIFRKNPGWREAHHARFTEKLKQAAARGAAALLLCNNPATSAAAKGKDVIAHWSAALGAPSGSGPIPYVFISQEIARAMLSGEGRSLEEIETALRKKGPASHLLEGVRVKVTTALTRTEDVNARNVVGMLPGRDPEVANEVVVLGAHYDHVGLGKFGSLGGAAAAGKIHNGADDNASGTVSLIELAEWFAEGANRPRRSLLFIAFTGEERGLLGSRHFVNHPTVPLADVVSMLNMDMVGRSRNGHLEMGGVGTAKGLKDLVAHANERQGLEIQWNPDGNAPTDSMSFFRKKIPVLFFFTGYHDDYHRPTDDVEKINFPDMRRVCCLCRDVCAEIGDADERLVYTQPPPPKRPPYIGIVPLREPDPRGVVVAQVQPGGPSAKAGMEEADVIVSIAGHVVRDLPTLLAALAPLTPDKTVPVVVLRDGERVTLKVTLGRRGGRRPRGARKK